MFLRSSRIVWALLLSCCFLGSVASTASAVPGDVDRSFGQEGVTSIESDSSAYVTPEDMALAPDGEIYVLRTVLRCSASPCAGERLVNRYLPNGLSDGSFGTAGVSTLLESTGGTHYSHSGSLAAPVSGQIVIGFIEGGKLVLARLNHDGTPDAGFGTAGTAGIAKFNLGIPVSRVRIAVQGDGKIVVAADPESGYGGNAVIVTRYTAQGTPDPTFHGGTPFVTSLGSGFGGFALTANGGSVLAGPSCCGGEGRAVHVTRLTENGIFDSGFGRQGESFVDDVTDGVGIGALIALPGGGVYVVGSSRGGAGDAFALKLTPTGTLSSKFGHGGIAYMKHSFLRVAWATVDRAGRLLIVGTAPTGTERGPAYGHRAFALLRRLPDGRRDRTFAGGSLVHLSSPGVNQVIAAGLQNGRKLVVLGSSGECIRTCPSPRSLLLRFLGGTSASRCQGHRATIVGTRHGEKLVGTRHRDVIAALAGNDLVFGRGGNDLICGGRGDDRLSGGKGRDVLRGGAGSNQLSQ